jgi:transcriptional regulator with XRE-family HTH domain
VTTESEQAPTFNSRLATAAGEAVHNLRIELGVSQSSLSEKSRLDRSYLGLLERGKRGISLESIWKISTALSIKPSELIARIESLLGASDEI